MVITRTRGVDGHNKLWLLRCSNSSFSNSENGEQIWWYYYAQEKMLQISILDLTRTKIIGPVTTVSIWAIFDRLVRFINVLKTCELGVRGKREGNVLFFFFILMINFTRLQQNRHMLLWKVCPYWGTNNK